MSHWNYRVIEFVSPQGEAWRAIHEVHYRDDGSLKSYGDEAAAVMGDEGDERGSILWTLGRMGEALDKPVLTKHDFASAEPCDG